jgi:beta-lactamase class D
MFALPLFLAAVLAVRGETVTEAFDGRAGAFVLVDCASGETYRNDPAACAEKVAPCSTFKIWNSAIGLETGLVTDPDAPFWKWDGKKYSIEGWNADQTLRSAIAVSCVPAFQALARQIGRERMQEWLDKLGYGDRDLSAGVDVFWLPEAGRKTLLISPDEQAAMIARLVGGKLPLSAKTRATLASILMQKKTERGTFYGKTGTGTDAAGDVGWFTGYVESGGQTYAFACLLKGRGVMGRDARAAMERILAARGFL